MENDNQPQILRLGPYPCTRKQRDIVARAALDGVDIFQKLVWMSIEARNDGYVQIPHVNEMGEKVVHGANKVMHNLELMYFAAAQSMILGLPEKHGRDWFPWMYIRNLQSRGDLPAWMAWLVEKNEGKVPIEWSQSDVKGDAQVAKERKERPK